MGQKKTSWYSYYGLQIFGLVRRMLNQPLDIMNKMAEEQQRYATCVKSTQHNSINNTKLMKNRQPFEGMMPPYSQIGNILKGCSAKKNYSSSALIYANYKLTRRYKPSD